MASLLGMFGFFTVLLRAFTLCFQSVAIGGILFFTVVARGTEERGEELSRSALEIDPV